MIFIFIEKATIVVIDLKRCGIIKLVKSEYGPWCLLNKNAKFLTTSKHSGDILRFLKGLHFFLDLKTFNMDRKIDIGY